jgi:hypothetical protein
VSKVRPLSLFLLGTASSIRFKSASRRKLENNEPCH